MRTIISCRKVNAVVLSCVTIISMSMTGCSNDMDDEALALSNESVEFVAQFTEQQEELLAETGSPYGIMPQRDSWNSVISPDIPATWGVFDDPRSNVSTRAVGIYGSYPAQYWTMLRVKLLQLPTVIKDGAIMAIEEIESNTNVRFYNSIEDEEYYEPYHIKYPNIAVRMNSTAIEGSGNYGLVGGEQYINVPTALSSKSSSEIKRFFIHAFCNAAGMFNEQQRNDRDDYVTITLDNVKDNCKSAFTKITSNYITQGTFDYYSITIAGSKDYSKNGSNTITKIGGYLIEQNQTLSSGDIYFLNSFYLPYIARTDNYVELDDTYYPNGQKLTETERLNLQNQINAQRGLTGTPPIENRKELVEW